MLKLNFEIILSDLVDLFFLKDAIKRRLQQHIFQKYEGEMEEEDEAAESEEEVLEMFTETNEKMMDEGDDEDNSQISQSLQEDEYG